MKLIRKRKRKPHFAKYGEMHLRKLLSCKDLCYQFNQIRPSDTEAQQKVLKRLFGKVGNAVIVSPYLWCDVGKNIVIGDHFFSNHNLTILDDAKVTFGNHVFVGPDCGFYTAEHPIDPERRNKGLERARPISVGDNVWIGGHVTILPGVTIGSNVTIGAGSVVTHDIPAGVVAYGVPCEVSGGNAGARYKLSVNGVNK